MTDIEKGLGMLVKTRCFFVTLQAIAMDSYAT